MVAEQLLTVFVLFGLLGGGTDARQCLLSGSSKNGCECGMSPFIFSFREKTGWKISKNNYILGWVYIV